MTDSPDTEKPEGEKEPSRALVSKEFEKRAWEIAVQFDFDAEEVRAAYAEKPESLKAAFNKMSEAKSCRNSNIGWTVAAIIFAPVLTPLPVYFAWKRHQEVQRVGQQVGFELDRFRRAPKQLPPPVPPAPPAPPPGLI
jgi:hypothetical protein